MLSHAVLRHQLSPTQRASLNSRQVGVEAGNAEKLVVQQVMVAKADGGREDDRDIGEDRAEPVGGGFF